MCGIAGCFHKQNITGLDTECVSKMSAVLEHRGPDDEGVYTDRTCALGHRRLAIIDLSAAGHQPFISDDGRYVLVYI